MRVSRNFSCLKIFHRNLGIFELDLKFQQKECWFMIHLQVHIFFCILAGLYILYFRSRK